MQNRCLPWTTGGHGGYKGWGDDEGRDLAAKLFQIRVLGVLDRDDDCFHVGGVAVIVVTQGDLGFAVRAGTPDHPIEVSQVLFRLS